MFERLSHRTTALPRCAAAITVAAAVVGAASPVAGAAVHGHAAKPSPTRRHAHHPRTAQSSVRQTAVLVLPDGTRQDFGTDIGGCLLAPVPGATRPAAPSHHDFETGPYCVISGG